MNDAVATHQSKPSVRLKKGVWPKLFLFMGAGLALMFGADLSPYKLKITKSESVSHSIFLSKPLGATIERGDYIELLPPTNPNSDMRVVKQIVGLPGDVVRVEGRDIYVNDIYRGAAKTHSLKGRPLAVTQSGVIPEGHYYVYGTHKDSHDSRYEEIGLVDGYLFQRRLVVVF